MAISERITYKKINNKYYKITFHEWDYYGGSRIFTNEMEIISEKDYILHQKTKQRNEHERQENRKHC